MAFSRRLGVVCILGACWFVAVGCNDDEDQKDSSSDGGEGGEAPSAGKSSVAGSANNAGKGGVGTAGEGGSGGTATAGSGGETPITGGAAGADTGNGGAAGIAEVPFGGAAGAQAGGAGGAGGEPSAAALACRYKCINDDDCAKPGPVTDTSEKCNTVTKRCENPNAVCDADSDCLAVVSEWVTSCLDDDGCFAGFEACVTSNGKGYCAALADANFPDFPCIIGSLITVPRFGAQGDVEVCGSLDARCFAGTCQAGCGDVDKGGCEAGEGSVCSATTGLCECATGAECTSQLCENSHCVECATSEQCAGSAQFTGLDICVNGKCGCSAPAVCPDGAYESASPVCE